MKRTLFLAAFILLGGLIMAQGVSPYSVRNIRLGFEMNNDLWLDKPDDVELKGFNRGVNLSLLYYHRFGESNFGIASGVVMASQNLYTKNAMLQTDDNGVSFFSTMLDTIPFQNYKLNLTYLELPLEFSFKTKSHLSFSLGAKVGYRIADKTKYKGKDFTGDLTNDLKMKVHNNDNLLDYRIGAFAVIGYKWINLTAYYQLTGLFEEGMGPDMSPLTVGILVRPY